jgi:putative NADH-flavin reductase
MKIAVLGAAGRSGIAFVEAALAAGHEIRAGIRNTNPFTDSPHLEVIHCDATHIKEVRRLLSGCDTVVSLIGHVKNSPPGVQTYATDLIITVMEELGIKRFVSLTGTGVRFKGDNMGLVDRFSNWAIEKIDPARIADGRSHVELIKESDLDYTILRVLKLQNIATKPYILTEHGPTKLVVGRKEVAKAIVEILEKKSFVQKAPMISPLIHN